MDVVSEKSPLLPYLSGRSNGARSNAITGRLGVFIVLAILALAAFHGPWVVPVFRGHRTEPELFYSSVHTPKEVCPGGISHSGFIGLKGDTEASPKRSFFWYFEAQEDAANAALILTIGGGPGTSGMLNPLFGQSHCIIVSNDSTAVNPNAWSKRFNLLALDHPIGTGYSYGTMVDNSRAAAVDVYDFLQKFYSLFPHLAKNPFVVSSGSYGGIYVPHIATVIREQNRAIAEGRGHPGAIPIYLESLIISDPWSDVISYFRWQLQQRCYDTDLYNTTTCTELFGILPLCMEQLEYAVDNSTPENRVAAFELCAPILLGDTHGRSPNDVRKKCDIMDLTDCFPQMGMASHFLNKASTKLELGVPEHVRFNALSEDVATLFWGIGDAIQRAHRLYEPLLEDGVRILHYTGMYDANVPPQSIISFLKLLRTRFQEEFINAPVRRWKGNETTIRVVGEGAGSMTLINVTNAGHLVEHDQPVLVRDIVEHWIDNRAFV